MKKTIWDKKIPTLLGLLIITIAIGITTVLVGKSTFFVQQASPTTNPQDVRITNVSDSSFTVSYSTSGPFLGSLNYGKTQALGLRAGDDKDNGRTVEHNIHSFTVKNLNPSTKYYFSIISGQDTYLNNDVPYELTTGPGLEKGAGAFVVGKVVTPDGNSPKEAIAYVTTDGAQTLSSIVKADGTYAISLEFLRNADLSTLFNFKQGSTIKMLIVSDSGSSNVTISVKDVNQVPTVVIGKSYDFTQTGENKEASVSGQLAQFPKPTSPTFKGNPQIITPAANQNFSTQTPLFRGTGIPNDTIKIVIQSNQTINGQVTVDSSGNWSFQPVALLSPGSHTITITAKDSFGILRTITQNFVVQAAGPQTTSTPTPSVFPTPTPSPIVISPTPSPSIIPSATPIVIATPPPTPRPTLPPTGTSEVPTAIMGVTLSVIGGFFFVLSKFLL